MFCIATGRAVTSWSSPCTSLFPRNSSIFNSRYQCLCSWTKSTAAEPRINPGYALYLWLARVGSKLLYTHKTSTQKSRNAEHGKRNSNSLSLTHCPPSSRMYKQVASMIALLHGSQREYSSSSRLFCKRRSETLVGCHLGQPHGWGKVVSIGGWSHNLVPLQMREEKK